MAAGSVRLYEKTTYDDPTFTTTEVTTEDFDFARPGTELRTTKETTDLGKHRRREPPVHSVLIDLGQMEASRLSTGPWKCRSLASRLGLADLFYDVGLPQAGDSVAYARPAGQRFQRQAVWVLQLRLSAPAAAHVEGTTRFYISRTTSRLLEIVTVSTTRVTISSGGHRVTMHSEQKDQFTRYGQAVSITLPAECS